MRAYLESSPRYWEAYRQRLEELLGVTGAYREGSFPVVGYWWSWHLSANPDLRGAIGDIRMLWTAMPTAERSKVPEAWCKLYRDNCC